MTGSHIAEQEYICCNSNSMIEYIEHVVDVASNIIEEDRLQKFVDKYDEWNSLPKTAVVDNDTENSHIFTAFNTNGSVNKFIKSGFWIDKRQS